MRFRFLFDPLFVACLAMYALNRFLLKPHLQTTFLHDHLNDLICIPFWVPIMLLMQRSLRLRGDEPPRSIEILIPLIVWSWAFELWLPSTDYGRNWCTSDPWDVFFYASGALGAGLFWRRWYRASRSTRTDPSARPACETHPSKDGETAHPNLRGVWRD